MSLKTLLTRNRSIILQAWQRLILHTYPDDGSTFLEKRRMPLQPRGEHDFY